MYLCFIAHLSESLQPQYQALHAVVMISQSEPCKQFQIHLKQNKHVNKIKHILAKFMLSTKHNFHGYMHMFLQSSTYNHRTKYICSQLAREQNACVKYVPSPTE